MNSQDNEFNNESLIKKLKQQVFENLVKLEKIFGKDIKMKRLNQNIITVNIDIKQSRELSPNHFEPLEVTVTCYYSLDPIKSVQYFKYSNFKGIVENYQKQLQELEQQYQNRKFGDWTLFYEFFTHTNEILNKIPKYLQTSLLDKRNLENQINQVVQQKIQTQELNGDQSLEERKTSNKIKNQRIQDMFSKNQHSLTLDNKNNNEEQQSQVFQISKRQQTFSRYENDFEQLEMLGRGGFGKVYKVRNRIDGNYYAVKKVKIYESQNKGLLKKMLLEVETLSKLHHPNIVRYYQAWIEHIEEEDDEDEDSVDDIFEHNQSKDSESLTSKQSNSSYSQSFQETTKKDIYSQSFMISFGDDVESNKSDKNKNTITLLYIQMEYCLQETLKEIIPKIDIKKDSYIINRLFLQIIDALSYIHSKNIIHRDIKPSNIFLDKNWNVKLGDFGLAKIFGKELIKKSVQYHSNDTKQSFIVGTPIYMSPEQKQGFNTHKSDMFSLGIILFEMIVPQFSTEMQRIRILTQFQQDLKCPSHLQHIQQNELYKILIGLLQKNPDERLSSEKLFTKFQHQLYKQYIISDQAEYENIIDSIFSNKQKFQRICTKEINQQIKQKKYFLNIKIAEKLNFIVNVQLKQFFSNKVQILPFIQIFSYVRVNRWKAQKDLFEISNQTINKMIDLDCFKKSDMFLNYRGDFVLSKKESFLRFCKTLEKFGVPLGKFYGFDDLDKNKIKLLFANITPDVEEAQIYNEIETFQIINNLLKNFEPLTQNLVCYKSSSILFDALINKIKLKDQDLQTFYYIVKNLKMQTQTQFFEIIKDKLPYLNSKASLILNFLKTQDKNFDQFIKKIKVILPNNPLIELYEQYERNLIQIRRNVNILKKQFEDSLKQENEKIFLSVPGIMENINFKYAILPDFDTQFPKFHSNQIFWIVDEQENDEINKNVVIYGGRFENIFHSKDQVVNGFVFDFNFLLQNKTIKKRLQENQLQMIQIFNSFSDQNSILIVSKFQPMLEEKLMVQELLWQEGMKVKIIYEPINNKEKDSMLIKKT